LIFVSSGTQNRPFNRLIEAADSLSSHLEEKIIAQIGHVTYQPKQIEYFRFCTQEEMLSYINRARLVISHAGFGIIGNAIRSNKPMILVPREKKYGEAVDKQYELAEYLASSNESIVCVRDVSRLSGAVRSLNDMRACYNYRTVIPELITDFILKNFFVGE
jgi:beta-1,4-N-acetylglucosaminyltransferase